MTNEISSGMALPAPHLSSAVLARKRRMEALRKQRSELSYSSDSESEPSSNKKAKINSFPSAVSSPSVSDSSPQKKDSRKSKAARDTQVRYSPDVPMPKEELAEWRKEARRVRNRESAAASRQKTRSRIDELEEELNEWKAKYVYAMERIRKIENERKRDHVHTVDDPPHMMLHASHFSHGVVSPCESPVLSPKAISRAVIQSMPQLSSLFSDCQTEQEQGRSQSQGRKKKNEPHPTKHLNEMISRPAVKITGAEGAGSLLIPPYFGFFPPSAPESAAIENMLPEFISDISDNDSYDTDDRTRSAPSDSNDTDTYSNDEDLEEFLLDALGGFDPMSAELLDVCV